ncbi:MAG: hypothetical protein LBC64_08055 [Fibromonadaceae bacterium]|jgi:hypothetical protein|nr:hypothetical protein [Fibromonadaceae bacterium]
MSEMKEMALENLSLFKNRSELHNVTQVPSDTGNAALQMATFPNVKANQTWLGNGEKFLDVQMQFDWIVYKVWMPNSSSVLPGQGQIQIRAKNLNNGANISFTPYNDPPDAVLPFQTLEFVDLNALRWVIVLCNQRCWKFRSDSTFMVNDIDANEDYTVVIDTEKVQDKNKLVEIFVEGYYYSFYKNFRGIEFSGLLNWGNNETVSYSSFNGFVDLAKNRVNYLASNNMNVALKMTKELRDIFVGSAIDSIQGNKYYYKTEVERLPVFNSQDDIFYRGGMFGISVIDRGWRAAQNINDAYKNSQCKDIAVMIGEPVGRWGDDIIVNGGRVLAFVPLGFTYDMFDDRALNNLLLDNPNAASDNPGKTLRRIIALLRELLPTSYANGAYSYNYTPPTFGFGKVSTATADSAVWINQTNSPQRYWDDFVNGSKFTYPSRMVFNNSAWIEEGQNPNTKLSDLTYNNKSVSQMIQIIDNAFNKYLTINDSTAWIQFASTVKANAEEGIIKGANAPMNHGLFWIKTQLEELKANNDISGLTTHLYNALLYTNELIELLSNVILACDVLINNVMPDGAIAKNLAEKLKEFIDTLYTRGRSSWNSLKSRLDSIVNILRAYKTDNVIKDIETISHMLTVVTDPDRFFYSDIGTTNIQGTNFYSTEYANSTPREMWRLGNRMVLFTNNTVEFWDITNDFEDPLSPAYSSNVFSLDVLPNSKVRFNDTLYFIAKPVELDSYSVYALTKTGQIAQISYPQLDYWLNKQIKHFNPGLIGSVISYENIPVIQWKIGGDASVLNFNIIYSSFFFSDNLYFLANDAYFKLGSGKAGTLDNFLKDSGEMIEAKIITPNTNFNDPSQKKRYKTVAAVHGDLEIEDRDDAQPIRHRFYRVSRMPQASVRVIKIKPRQGKRNAAYRIIGIGMGIDFQTEISWQGYLRLNNFSYEVE